MSKQQNVLSSPFHNHSGSDAGPSDIELEEHKSGFYFQELSLASAHVTRKLQIFALGIIRTACPEFCDTIFQQVRNIASDQAVDVHADGPERLEAATSVAPNDPSVQLATSMNKYVAHIFQVIQNSTNHATTYDVIGAACHISETIQLEGRFPSAGECLDFLEQAGSETYDIYRPYSRPETDQELDARLNRIASLPKSRVSWNLDSSSPDRQTVIVHRSLNVNFEAPVRFSSVFKAPSESDEAAMELHTQLSAALMGSNVSLATHERELGSIHTTPSPRHVRELRH